MCFSKETSIASFVIGTLINVAVGTFVTMQGYDNLPWRYAILALWQFAILMQLPEAVGWGYVNRGTQGPPSVERAAYWLNNLQPAAAFVFIVGTYFLVNQSFPSDPIVWVALIAAVLATAAFTITAAAKSGTLLGRPEGIAPGRGCDHLNLHWWSAEGLKPYLPLYLIAIFACIMLLPSASMQITQSSVFFGTLLLSSALYSCGVGSLWCWSVVAAGLTVLVP